MMGFDQHADDGQAEAEAPPRLGPDPHELLEDAVGVVDVDAGSVVDDPELDPVAGPRRRDLDRASRRVVHRVLEQVRERVLHHHEIDLDGRRVGRHRDGHGPVGEVPRGAAQRGVHHVVGRRGQDPGGEGTRPDPGQIEHLRHQVVELGGVGVRDLEQLVALGLGERRAGHHERGGRGLDRGQGCAQVVGHRGEERGARPRRARRRPGGGAPRRRDGRGRARRRGPRPGCRAWPGRRRRARPRRPPRSRRPGTPPRPGAGSGRGSARPVDLDRVGVGLDPAPGDTEEAGDRVGDVAEQREGLAPLDRPFGDEEADLGLPGVALRAAPQVVEAGHHQSGDDRPHGVGTPTRKSVTLRMWTLPTGGVKCVEEQEVADDGRGQPGRVAEEPGAEHRQEQGHRGDLEPGPGHVEADRRDHDDRDPARDPQRLASCRVHEAHPRRGR